MMHKVCIVLNIEADEYKTALDHTERWLRERREGNALELYPEGTTRIDTIPKIPHPPLHITVEKTSVYVVPPSEAKEVLSPPGEIAIPHKTYAIHQCYCIECIRIRKEEEGKPKRSKTTVCAHIKRINGICQVCGDKEPYDKAKQQASCQHFDRLNGICKSCGFDLMKASVGNFAYDKHKDTDSMGNVAHKSYPVANCKCEGCVKFWKQTPDTKPVDDPRHDDPYDGRPD